jgi:hypothetical protein
MGDSLGLSIGMTNLVAAREGRPPVVRRAVLTLFNDRGPEVGVPGENPNLNQPGLVLGGFVDRVGDPVPLVASDGSSHRGDQVLAEALDAMAHTVGGGSPITIAAPAHWSPATVSALQVALRGKPGLSSATLVPDSVAALAGLRSGPGLPSQGVIALIDLGGSGTSITLADAGADLAPLGTTQRYPDFSGDQIDQALLNHVIAGIAEANNTDPASTAAVGSLGRLREECRRAKERLSADTATVVPAELPGFASDVRVTRPELEQLIEGPLGGLLNAVDEVLQRNRIPVSSVSAVATVGGGAAIPLVTQRLSERLQAPVISTPYAQVNTAVGAALVAGLASEAAAATGLAPAASADAAPTGLAPTMGWAGAAAAPPTAAAPGLAWSQDNPIQAGEPVPYEGPDYATGFTDARPEVAFAHDDEPQDEPAPLPWYKRPPLLFGAAAAAVLLAGGGLAITLTGNSEPGGTVIETATSFSTQPGESTQPAVTEPQTVTVTGSDGLITTSEVPPPPPPSTTTTTTPSTTSSTTTTTTTTTTSSTTTTTTTTTPPTTTTTTQPPTTTTTKPPTTSAAPPTTSAAPPTTTVVQSGNG